ncbi:MAG: DUF937 domain-containing protein [Hyphomicrobiales bacterium]|nr:DUF937 domain-containing protein [Hyphomicrobiales bacterium]
MGYLDDALQQVVPGGDLTKPIAIAIGALIMKQMLGGGVRPGAFTGGAAAPAPAPAPTQDADAGGLFGGLGNLLNKFQQAGHGDTVNSWVSNGPNQPIQPAQIGNAVGQSTISDIARQAGMSEQDLLNQLSQVLPGLVDKLTPQGRMPDPSQWGRR